ncbi:MAG: type III-B CRISPR-associated protein Cas10/Cmr2 [Nostoc sp. NMS1]|uniref:type III-B CRISPR-associated protein Cas10/Cmr2 n=2 Tax=Nostoc TaxID=1177 RepID=UPI0025F344A1|nr:MULTISPECIES: type III-B CRISPR-associated protein Cas10/Cmr2 [unclassified Nostoc]MBN3911449.1 type III-B CRISPR-associated protein Cas10/Cmr2 [Nostoc sp. NMS1]MBN3989601.1 type III-B CRISPR-associated protein Cas10/Cmr2 [Nostoc sp. NMS2]
MEKMSSVSVAIAWCLAWGDERKPKYDLPVLQKMHQALKIGEQVSEEFQELVDAVNQLDNLPFPQTVDELENLTKQYPILWKSKIGLIYGGATKIKQYVFEESKLPDIRGASGLLDRINLVDLPAFFNVIPESRHNYNIQCGEVRRWLNENFSNNPNLSDALIPELIIYSTGGNILAFCPAAFVDDIANAIEKVYTKETLTANSCAVGETFRLLEIRLGLLKDNIAEIFWLEKYQKEYKNSIVEACFGKVDDLTKIQDTFEKHKSFNELTTKLAIRFNQRRSGNKIPNRPTHCYPPIFETHLYLRRDEGDKHSAIAHINQLTGQPYLSETLIRKRRIGDRAKTGISETPKWYQDIGLKWEAGMIESWLDKFDDFLRKNTKQSKKYYGNNNYTKEIKIPQSLTQLGKVSNGYVAYIYADGNNMGGFIQNIRTPEEYQEFSQDVENATKYAVYQALAYNLHPREIKGISEPESKIQDGDLIHPFEIITIGGDDILLIVPADRALQIAKMIGEQFEEILLKTVTISGVKIKGKYQVENNLADSKKFHRCDEEISEHDQCKLSMSSGVLITAYNTPIYYAEDLTNQLMKSAKKSAKTLKENGYYGGTVDFLTMKSVIMISSSIEEFRQQALTIENRGVKLKLYAAPYTLAELDKFLKSIHALRKAEFPKSQLYQVRSFLERGKRTASLNYYYFRHRLKKGQSALKTDFENIWCQAKTNEGYIPPWMYDIQGKMYETIWREMVDLYDLIDFSDTESPQLSSMETAP